MGNRERIIEGSLELFNERGTHSVSTNHIAAHLSISPGNLYYHFANREEIIRAIYPAAEEAVRRALPVTPDRAVTAAEVGSYHLAGIETLWSFRFFFRDADEMIMRDEVLAESFQALNRWLSSQFKVLLERLILQGQMRRPEPPGDLDRVATNAVIIWTNWIRYLTNSRGTVQVDHIDMVEGAIHSFLTFTPYLDLGFAQEVRAVFDERALQRPRQAAAKTGRRARQPAAT